MRVNAGDFVKEHGWTGAAIQAAVAAAAGGRVEMPMAWPNVWELSEPLVLGPWGWCSLEGEAMGSFTEPGAGTFLDATRIPLLPDGAGGWKLQDAIRVKGGHGFELERFSILLGACNGIHLDSDAKKSQTTSAVQINRVTVGSPDPDPRSTALLFQSSALVNPTNEQCGSEVEITGGCRFDAGFAIRVESAQAVNIAMRGGSVRGAVVGIHVALGALATYGVNFATRPSTIACVQQLAGQGHFQAFGGYAEVAAGDFFRGVGNHDRPSLIDGVRVYMQRGNPGHFINAPDFENLVATAATVYECNHETKHQRPLVHHEAIDEAKRLTHASRELP